MLKSATASKNIDMFHCSFKFDQHNPGFDRIPDFLSASKNFAKNRFERNVNVALRWEICEVFPSRRSVKCEL